MDPHGQSLIPIFITEQLERATNLALDYAPVTRMQLAKLRGKQFALELQRPHFPLLIEVGRSRLRFQSNWDDQADVTVRGPALALMRQLRSENNTPGHLMQNGIEIDGDQQLAQQFMTLLKDLDLDIESALGDLIGDLAAHQISEVARTGLSWLKQAAKAVTQQSQHLVVEERNWVVKRKDFSRFQEQVTQLRQDSERLQARLEKLKQANAKQDETSQ